MCAGVTGPHVPWTGHEGPRPSSTRSTVDARDRLLHQTYALTGDLPGVAQRGAGRVRRRLAPLAQGVAARGPRGLGPAAGLAARAAPAHRPASGTATRARPRGPRDPRRPRQAQPRPAQGAAAHPAHPAARMDDWPARSGCRCAEAERELQTATAQFAVQRDVRLGDDPHRARAARGAVADTRWPRATIIRRAGTARRRTAHRSWAPPPSSASCWSAVPRSTDAQGVRPAPDHGEGRSPHRARCRRRRPQAPARALRRPAAAAPASSAASHPIVAGRSPSTSDDTAGDGLMLPCQSARFADPGASAAWCGPSRPAPVQADHHRRPRRRRCRRSRPPSCPAPAPPPRRAYTTTTGWFAGCPDARVQLLASPTGGPGRRRGDPARPALLGRRRRPRWSSAWPAPGLVTTTTLDPELRPRRSRPGRRRRRPAGRRRQRPVRRSRARATCAGSPTWSGSTRCRPARSPGCSAGRPAPGHPASTDPWVGTEPRKAVANAAATHCDETDFAQPPITNALTRTFLFPEADLPTSSGSPRPSAAAAPAGPRVRGRRPQSARDVRGQEARHRGRSRLADESDGPDQDLTVWRRHGRDLRQMTVTYLMGIVRTARPSPRSASSPTGPASRWRPGDFLRARPSGPASDRLAELPRARHRGRQARRLAAKADPSPIVEQSDATIGRSQTGRPVASHRRPASTSRISWAVSDGVLPTLTPTASRASFLACGGAGRAGDDGAGVAHGLALGGGEAGDVADDRLGDVVLDVGRRPLLGVAADLADHHDRLGLGVVLERLRARRCGWCR